MTNEEQEKSISLELFQDMLISTISPNGIFPETDELPHPKIS